jgi:hypothetical protein
VGGWVGEGGVGDREWRNGESPFVGVIEDFDAECAEAAPCDNVIAACLVEHPSAGSACDDADATAGG